jgi:hypothetical protein
LFYTFRFPRISDIINSTINTKKSIFAIPAALAAIPANPKTPAIKAITKKVTDHRNIVVFVLMLKK